MDVSQELEDICREVPGCYAAVVMNLDGMVVFNHLEKGNGLDMEVLLVELASSIKQAIQAVANANGGELDDIVLGFGNGCLVMRMLKEEHFVALLMEPTALAGKGRYALRTRSLSMIKNLF